MWLPRAQTRCLPQESYSIWAGRRGSEGACGHVVRDFWDWGWSIQLGIFKSAGRWKVKSKVHKSPETPSTHGVRHQKGDSNLLFNENLAYFSNHGSIGWSFTATVLWSAESGAPTELHHVERWLWSTANLNQFPDMQSSETNPENSASICVPVTLAALIATGQWRLQKNPLCILMTSISKGKGQWKGRKRVK